MKTIKIIKILGIITSLFLLPSISNAQIQRVWNIPEYTSTIAAPPATGAKIAFRTINNSVFYWNGTVWKRMAGPGIVDTNYTISIASSTISLDGSGTSVDIAPYVSTSPTTIAANYIATSNGTNLVARNLFDNGTAVSILNSKPFQLGQWTTAGRPTGTAGYMGWRDGTTLEWYNGTRWATGLESTFARGTATRVPFFDANGQITENSGIRYLTNNLRLGGSTATTTLAVSGSATFELNDNQGFNITGVSGNNPYIITGNNGRTLRFVPSGSNFYGPGIAASALIYDNVNSSVGLNLADITTPYITIPTNSLILKTETNLLTAIVSSTNLPLLTAYNPSGSTSQLKIYGGYRTGTNQSVTTYPFQIAGATGTGTGTPGDIEFQTGTSGSTGTTAHALTTRWYIKGQTGFLSNTNSPTEDFHVIGDGRFGDSLRVGSLPNQTSAIKILSADNSGWIGYKDFSNFATSNVYTANGTFGAGRIGTLTDSLRIQFGGSDLLRLKSNGVLHVNMPTESNSFVITSTPSENYNNYRGKVFMVGTTSTGDTTSGFRRNNHESSYFSGDNLVEGGDNVYYNSISGYGNIIRGNVPKNIIHGTYNTINGSDNNVFGYLNTINASGVGVLGQANTVTQDYTFVYGNNGNTSINKHGFGTVTPSARLHVKSLSGVPTILADGGEVQFNAYGTNATTATALSKTESGYLASFATDGTVVSSQILRDTFVTANTSFSVGTLLNTCQELHVTMSVTVAGVIDYFCILPTPSATLRGKKVTLYCELDASALYNIVAGVSGGGSTLYFTTNTKTTAPTAQANLSLDGTTWGNQGASYTFVCKLINGTYYWVLENNKN